MYLLLGIKLITEYFKEGTDKYGEYRYIKVCLWRRADLSWSSMVPSAALEIQPPSLSGVRLSNAALTCEVVFEVTVGGAPLPVLAGVGQPFPVGFSLTAQTVRAAQVGQPPGRRSLFRLGRDAAVGLLAARVSQVLQVEGPGSKLLPVDPLKGHYAVQVATQLRVGGGGRSRLGINQQHAPFPSAAMTRATFLVLRC